MQSRNVTLDVMKGAGIVLVVIYHVLGKGNPLYLEELNNGLFNMIACFFMQIFMVVSGYLAYGKFSTWQVAFNRVKRWLPPVFVFLVVYWLWGQLFPGLIKINQLPFGTYIRYSLVTGFTGLVTWYIWCLVLCYLMAYTVEWWAKRYPHIPIVLIVFCMVVTVNVVPVNYFGFMYLKWYGLFFMLGYMLRHYRNTKVISIGKKAAYGGMALFPLCGYLVNWMIPYQDINYGYIGTAAIMPAIINGKVLLLAVMTGMALLGVICIYALSKVMAKWRYTSKVFSYLGVSTVGVYFLHIMFVGISSSTAVSVILSLSISLVLYEMLRRIRVVNRVLFGGIDK